MSRPFPAVTSFLRVRLHQLSEHSSKGANFATGRLNSPNFVFTSADVTTLSDPGEKVRILPRGQHPLGVPQSTISTRSPTFRLGTACYHFLRAVKPGKYSCNHLFQMWVVMTCACRQRFWLDISLSAKIPGGKLGVALPMRKWFGVNASRSSASELTSVNGRLLTRDSTSVIAVNNTSSVRT